MASLTLVSGAHAQFAGDTIYLPEGETREGSVISPAAGSRIVVDLSGNRIDPATGELNTGVTANSPALLTGDLFIYGNADELWLRSEGTATASMFEGTARTAGGIDFNFVVYEASGNDSVLTLTPPSTGGNLEMNQTLHLGGDGTIILEGVVNTTATPDMPAIVVEAGSTSQALGEGGDGKIDLVIAANVVGQGTGTGRLIDAREADSITVRNNASVNTTSGTALDAGEAETIVEAGASIQIRETSLATAAGSAALKTSSSVNNLGTISGINTRAAAGNYANGIDATDATITNRRNGGQVGKIQASGNAILARGETYIQNDGEISSLFGAGIQAQGIGSTTVLRNGAAGLIRVGAAFESTGTSTTAYQGVSGTDVVINAGTIEGDVLLGDGNDIYLVQGAGTVDGAIDGGAGDHDAYGRSYTASATAALANNALNVAGRTGFEMHGIEASGTGTTVTVTATETLANGIQLIGDGTVINTANISSGGSYGVFLRDIANVPGGGTFINRGAVNSDNFALRGENVSGTVRNEGALAGRLGVAIEIDEDARGNSLEFVNTGEISAIATTASAFSAFIDKQGHVATITNGGNIRQRTAGSASDTAFGLNVRSRGTVRLSNSGTIDATSRTDGGARVEADRFEIDNGGTIEGAGEAGSGLTLIARGNSEGGAPERVGLIVNSGTIRANGGGGTIDGGAALAYGLGVEISGNNAVVEAENSGMIAATGAGSVAVYAVGSNPDGAGLTHFRMTNRGTIRGSGSDTVLQEGDIVRRTAMSVPGALGDSDLERQVASAIQTYHTTDHIVNEGTIIGNVDLADGDDRFENRGTVEGDVRLGEGDDSYVFALGGTLTGTAYGGQGDDVLLIDGSGNVNGRLEAAKYREFERIEGLAGVPQGTGILSVAGSFDVDTVGLSNIAIQVDAGDTVGSQSDTVFTGGNGSERITNLGTIAGAVDLGGGDDTVINAGYIQGNVLLGAGNDRYAARAGSVVDGAIDGGDGIDTFEFLLSGDIGQLPGGILNFESFAARGDGTLNLSLDEDIDTIELLDGADLVLNEGTGRLANVLGDDSSNTVTITGTLTGSVSLGGGDDVLNMSLEGTLSGALDGGAGNDTLNLTLTGASTINGMSGFEVANVSGSSPLTLAGSLGAGQTLNFDGSDNELIVAAGANFEGTVNGGEGRDTLRIQSGSEDSRTVIASQIVSFEDLAAEGLGTLALTGGSYSFQTVSVEGTLELGNGTGLASAQGVAFGAGDNRLRLGSGATVTGGVDGGEGTDTLELIQEAGYTRSLASIGARGFERLASSGAGVLDIDADASFESVSLSGGTTNVAAGTVLTAPVTGSAGAERLAVFGTIEGDVDLGGGDDRLTIASLDAITGVRSGGEGNDTLELRTTSSYEAPTAFDGTGFDSFENLAVGGGVVSLTADTTWNGVSVEGGRLIGQAGTTLTSATAIQVARGGTFGSAGTVNGDIDVYGTLSPGSSPGTMTVNGDIVFRTGSNLLLEVTPAESDLLRVSGTLNIEQGAGVDITGILSSVPGETLDLVVAEGGINGRFTTVNRSEAVFGFVVQNGNRLQIRSEFQNSPAYPANIQASIDYSNQVLRSGYGVQAYTAALPVLTAADGTINATAFAQLTPEAYASAAQIGTETALATSDTIRQVAAFMPIRKGFNIFAQGMFGDTNIDGHRVSGASANDVDVSGILGGVNYGFGETAQIGAFIGAIDNEQSIAGLDARTSRDGVTFGLYGNARLGQLGLYGMVAYSEGRAHTLRRIAAAAGEAKGRFDLKTWVLDAAVDYRFDLGTVAIAPRLGVTYADTRRGRIVESGGGDFALAVAGQNAHGLFGDAAVVLSTTFPVGSTLFAPYGEIGARYRIDGSRLAATGGFVGAPGAPMQVLGAGRDNTVGRVAAGLGVDLSPKVRLNISYAREFDDTAHSNIAGGLIARF